MTDVEDTSLLDLALGLRDDPELARAVRSAPELRKRFRAVKRDLKRLDGELRQIEPQDADDRRRLRLGPWRILLAVDDSEPSARAVDAAAVMAEASGGEILVLHVREITPTRTAVGASLEPRWGAEQLVADIVDRLRLQGIRAEGEMHAAQLGHAAYDIAYAARCIGADLVIMGSRGHSGLAALFAGSVAHQAIRRAHCPVLVVP
jgi:nucleotide-binding universal stress UspA family protein